MKNSSSYSPNIPGKVNAVFNLKFKKKKATDTNCKTSQWMGELINSLYCSGWDKDTQKNQKIYKLLLVVTLFIPCKICRVNLQYNAL